MRSGRLAAAAWTRSGALRTRNWSAFKTTGSCPSPSGINEEKQAYSPFEKDKLTFIYNNVLVFISMKPSPSKSSIDRLRKAFRGSPGVLRTGELLRAGVHPRTLYALREAGVVESLGRGLFRLA